MVNQLSHNSMFAWKFAGLSQNSFNFCFSTLNYFILFNPFIRKDCQFYCRSYICLFS